MAVRGALVKLASEAPVPVFVAAGAGSDLTLARLRSSPHIEIATTPRAAMVLVVAGAHPRSMGDPLRLVHDQVPPPRAAVVLEGAVAVPIPGAVRLDGEEPVDGLRRIQRDLLAGSLGTRELGPADNPVEWRGVGPYGTGGEGMMGGKPYGRPMAMTSQGRDGMSLDRLHTTIGPFFPGLPGGLQVMVGLQGDVVEDVEVDRMIDAAPGDQPETPSERARRLLAASAELLAMTGLVALARSAARIAVSERLSADRIDWLRRRLDRPWGLRPATDGIGRLPVTGGTETDVTDRWRRWLTDARSLVSGGHEPSHGDTGVDLEALAGGLRGMELGQMLLTLASLRPELSAAPVQGTVTG